MRSTACLVDGVTVEYRTVGGAVRGAQVSVLDYENACQQRLAGGRTS